MSKKTFSLSVFLITLLTATQFAAADYTITNGSATDPAWVTYSVWKPASGIWPEGWRTRGWYKIDPGATRNLPVLQQNTSVYIRIVGHSGEMKPADHATRRKYSFWIHPTKAFTVVETDEGDFLKSDHNKWSLETADLYEYRNGGSHTITAETRLPDLPAQRIYDQAIHSVVWIETKQGNGFGAKGSGVLIDKKRQLVVTNEHVVRNAKDIYVFFPWRNHNGKLDTDEGFYLGHWGWLETRGYGSKGRVIAQNVRNDLAIIQLNQLPPTAREIQHDFSKNVENSMRRGDKVHILGNPGERLWNWTQGTFLQGWRDCLPSGGDCLELEGDAEGGNSGGPVLNGRGMLIGILAAGTDDTVALAVPAKNVKTLLNRVPANLPPIPPKQTYPKRTFKIRNRTGVSISYQIKWSNSNNWQPNTLKTGFVRTHRSGGQNIPSGYPKIRFDYIAGDQQVTYRLYTLETAQFQGNATNAPTYYFQYNWWGNRLDLLRDTAAAPTLSSTASEETAVFANYPNPFNPETWIPYQLAKPSQVTVTLYSADGRLVRTLPLGHQSPGVYQSKSRAAYWDGRNAQGEPVASGVYFYTLTAGDFTATRKLLVRK